MGLFGSKAVTDASTAATTPLHPRFPISVLKPLKGVDPGLAENLRSFFELDDDAFELVFCLESSRDPAYAVVRSLLFEYPHVAARVIIDPQERHLNPKIRNLESGYHAARYDWILISDSNVRVPPTYLGDLRGEVDPDTGIVSSLVHGVGGEGFVSRVEAALLHTFYARGMLLAEWIGHPCVIGKAMLFPRSTLARVGGIEVLGQYLAEDYFAGLAMRHLALKVRISKSGVPQVLGRQRFRAFWDRHVRWGRIRSAQAPLAYAIEWVGWSVFQVAVAGFALGGGAGLAVAAMHAAANGAMHLRIARRLGPSEALALLAVELLQPIFWFAILSSREVRWRGASYRIEFGGRLVPRF